MKMTQEEFQKTILKELKGLREDIGDLKDGQKQLTIRVGALEKGQRELTSKVDTLEKGQKELTKKVDIMDKKIDVIYDETAYLTEFREKATKDIKNNKADNEVLKEMVIKHEIEIKALERKIG